MGTTLPAGDGRSIALRRALIPIIVALSLLASQLPPFLAASAEAVVGGPWTIDGVVPDSTPTLQNFADACNAGNADDKPRNGNAYKLENIHTAAAPAFDTGNVTGKGDLCNVWLDLATANDDVLLYFGWRRHSPEGAVNVSLELHQGQTQAACTVASPDFFSAGGCNPFRNRQAGDLLLTFDFDPVPAIYKRTWNGSAWTPAAGEQIPASLADVAIDSAAQNSTLRGEAAINLTDAGILPGIGEECVTFAEVLPFSQTGNSATAELQDIVLNGYPGPSISNCGVLTVTKVTSPTGLAGPFPVSLARGATPLSDFQLAQHGSSFTYGDTADEPLFAGTDYRLTETVPSGWNPNYTVACTINGANAIDGNGNITVQATRTTACTITNTVIPPTITLVKTVQNSFGGTATAADFQARLDGQNVAWGSPVTTTVGSHTASEVVNVSGYTASAWGGDCAANGSITLGPGQTATCTITNSDVQPTLELRKTVVNTGGGTATADDFQARIDGSDVDWGAPVGLNAGSHTASETTLPGYQAGPWGGACAANGTVNLAVGQTAVCTITNTAIPPKLRVVKQVVNNAGGTLGPADFPLFVNGQPVTSGAQTTVVAGTAYTVTETQQPGYAQTGLVCVDDASGAALGHPVTLALAQNATCTMTNDDVTPGLTVVKDVINDDGGDAAPGDFQLRVNGGPIQHGVALGNPQAGVPYSVSEDDPSALGYEFVSTVCVDAGTQQQVVNPVVLALGQAVVCTVTNDDIAPTVTVTKQVINDDGGTAQVGDFTLYLGDDEVTSGATNVVAAGAEYTVSEDLVAGYEQVSLRCTDGDRQLGATFTPGLADEIDCVIVNDDVAPTVTVTKVVVNDDGGTAQVGDFTLYLGDDEVTSGASNDVTAGVEYTVSEDLLPGFEQTALSCTDGESQLGDTFTPQLAQTIDCVIVNDDVAPTVTVIKEVVNEHGGDAEAGDFTLRLNGDTVASGATTAVTAGVEYTVSEDAVDAYEQVSIACTDAEGADVDTTFTPELAQDVTCTIVNADLPSGLSIVKEALIEPGSDGLKVVEVLEGETAVISYRFTVTNTGQTTLTDLTLVDDKIGPITLDVDTLPPGGSTVATADYTVTAADIAAGRVENVGIVTGTNPYGDDVSDEDDETVEIVEVLAAQPAITIVKEALVDEDDDGDKVVEVDEGETTTVTYRYTITNTGNVTLDDLALVDDKIGDIALPVTSLAPGQSITVEATYTLTAEDIDAGEVENVAIVRGTDPDGTEVSDQDDEVVLIVEVRDVEVKPTVIRRQLPRTGTDGLALFALGLLLTSVGLAALLLAPRRRREA